MPSLKEVKSRILSVTSTQQITKAMKMVAAAKLRRAQDNIIQMRPYAQKLSEILQNVSANNDGDIRNIYGEQRPIENVLLIPVTSDKGLCGPFNSNVFKTTRNVVAERYADQRKSENLTVMPIGKRSLDYYSKLDYPLVDDYAHLFGSLTFDEARVAAEYAMEQFVAGKYDQVVLVYNEFKNVATQVLRVEQLLPLATSEVTEDEPASTINYIYEPDKARIIEELIPKSLKIQFYKALLESNAAEHGARMTAMDKATENAGELLKELKLIYNRTRQAAITKEILEIVAGAEALAAG